MCKVCVKKILVRALKQTATATVGLLSSAVLLQDVNWYLLISTLVLTFITSCLTDISKMGGKRKDEVD